MIFFSSFCTGAEDIKGALQKLINAGIRNIELNNGEKYIFDIANVLEKFKKEYGLNFLIHNYFPTPKDKFVLNLASQNRLILNRTIAHCKKAVELAGKLKVPVYSVHAGMRLDPHPSELGKAIRQINPVSYEAAYNTLVRSLEILCDYARDFDVEIAVENHVLAPLNLNHGKNELLLMCESREFLQLFKDVRKANLKVLIDLGHLKVTSATLGFDRVDFINKLKDRISLFHLSENNSAEDTHEMVDEHSWFWDALRDFQDTRCVVESFNLTLEQIASAEHMCQRKLVYGGVPARKLKDNLREGDCQ